jgi:hypothetical protein
MVFAIQRQPHEMHTSPRRAAQLRQPCLILVGEYFAKNKRGHFRRFGSMKAAMRAARKIEAEILSQ